MRFRYEDLIVWQKAMQLAQVMYVVTSHLPAADQFGLTTQLRRSSVSIASNISEGQGRLTRGEFRRFLGTAQGSLYEACTQMLLAKRLKYTDETDHRCFSELAADVSNLISALIKTLKPDAATRNLTPETYNK